MNFYPNQLNTFVSKLINLFQKIQKSSKGQIQAHTLLCHQLVVKIVKDEALLNNMNAQKLRLLAYESILFVVEILKGKDQNLQNIQKVFAKNKILSYLVQIQNTLCSIKQILSNLNLQRSDSRFQSPVKNFPQRANLNFLDRSLNQYQLRLGNLIEQFQENNKIKDDPNSISIEENNKQAQNQYLIQQMNRILQKKQRRISQLTVFIKQVQKQKLQIQVQFKKNQLQGSQKISSLQKLLQNHLNENKNLQRALSSQQQTIQRQKKYERIQKNQKLKIQNQINQIVNYKLLQCQNSDFNYKIQAFTQQTISSLKVLKGSPAKNPQSSLHKIAGMKSFRKISNSEQKQIGSSQRKVRQTNFINQQLYRLILCQASTIEELY